MTECPECERREKQFITVRNERTFLLLDGKMTGEILHKLRVLDEQELAALSANTDHKIEHHLMRG